MNSRGSWEGISNASPAASSCCVYELLCKTDFSLRMLISSWLSSLCEAITLPKPQAPNRFSFNTTQHTGKKTQCFCQVERLIIDLKRKPRWLLYTYTSGEGRSLALRIWHSQTTSLWCLTGAGSWGFLDPQQGHWTGYHALWSHTLSPADREDCLPFVSNPLLTSTSYCHVVSWGSCHVNRAPPSQTTPVLIPTTHFTPINNTGNLFPKDVFIAEAAKINLKMTNKFKRRFIMWPIRETRLISVVLVVLKAWTFGWA